MTDNVNQMHRGGGERPKLRCPVCSTMVELPAVDCPKCSTNLRTGYTPPDNSRYLRSRLIFGGFVLLLVIIAAVAVLFFNKEEPYQAPAVSPVAVPAAGHSDITEAVDAAQSISDGNIQISTNPTQAKPILDQTQRVTDRARAKQRLAEDAAGDGNE